MGLMKVIPSKKGCNFKRLILKKLAKEAQLKLTKANDAIIVI